MTSQSDQAAIIMAQTITDLKSLDQNEGEITLTILGSFVAVLIEMGGVNSAARYLRQFADEVEKHQPELEGKPN